MIAPALPKYSVLKQKLPYSNTPKVCSTSLWCCAALHMQEDFAIDDFALDEADMARILAVSR